MLHNFRIALFSTVLFIPVMVQAELVTESPPQLSGVIVSAGSKLVTLRLEDGRTEIKVPRSGNFSEDQEFFPGRIVSIPVTPSLRSYLGGKSKPGSESDAPSEVTDEEFIKAIQFLQKGSQKEERAAVLDLSDFLIRRATAAATGAPSKHCGPISQDGDLLDMGKTKVTRNGSIVTGVDCFYGKGSVYSACKSAAAISRFKSEHPKVSETAIMESAFNCNPLLFGEPPSCMYKGESDCFAVFDRDCKKWNLNQRECIQKRVLPYVKSHAVEFSDYAKSFVKMCQSKNPHFNSESCADPIAGGLVIGIGKNLLDVVIKNGEYLRKREEENTITGCELVPGDSTNADLSSGSGASNPAFTTLEAPSCGGKKFCVREVKCYASLLPSSPKSTFKRFARCSADKCKSARACLDDKGVSGKSTIDTPPPVSSSSVGS